MTIKNSENPNKIWLRLSDLTERYSCSPSTIWRWSKTIPAFTPVKISQNTTCWNLAAIEEYEAQQMRVSNHG